MAVGDVGGGASAEVVVDVEAFARGFHDGAGGGSEVHGNSVGVAGVSGAGLRVSGGSRRVSHGRAGMVVHWSVL